MNFNASTPRYPQPPLRKLSKRPTDTPGLDSSKPYPASQPSYPASQPSYPASQPSYPAFDNSQQFQPYDNYPQNQPYAPGPPYGGYPGGTGPPGMAPPFNPGMGQAPPQPGMTMPTQLFSDPLVANVAMSYGSKIMGSGKEYVDREIEKYVPVSRLKYYFAVDTSYVLRKLKLLFFPFTHTDWSVKYEHNEPVQPRYEVNAPDLYIPTMAYVTYVLVAGLALGTQNRFAPEVLGMLASSALAWSTVEILVALVTLYITNTNTKLKTFDLIAFAGYKYVGIIVAVLLSLVANKTGYYLGLIYCGFSLAFFTMRSLKWQVLAEVTNTADAYSYAAQGNKRRLYFLLFMACLQPVLMWWLSAHLVPPPLPPAPPNMLQS